MSKVYYTIVYLVYRNVIELSSTHIQYILFGISLIISNIGYDLSFVHLKPGILKSN